MMTVPAMTNRLCQNADRFSIPGIVNSLFVKGFSVICASVVMFAQGTPSGCRSGHARISR